MATVAAVERCLATDYGLRLAQPGEFTRRALDNGMMDLTQVEALSDLLEAETESQRRQALRVLDGAIGRVVAGWRAHLVKAAALVETSIDFVEEDVGNFDALILSELRAVVVQLQDELAGGRARERVQSGFEVALVGPVNAGKSSLLNALAGRDAAITSDIAGTTRDVLEVRMDVGGFAVTFLDTAGLRETTEQVEAIGIARGRARAEQADLRIILHPADDPSAPNNPVRPRYCRPQQGGPDRQHRWNFGAYRARVGLAVGADYRTAFQHDGRATGLLFVNATIRPCNRRLSRCPTRLIKSPNRIISQNWWRRIFVLRLMRLIR